MHREHEMRALSLVSFCFLVACGGATGPDTGLQLLGGSEDRTGSPGPGGEDGRPGDAVLGHDGFALLLNDERANGGVRAVAEHAALSRAAQDHARDMVENGYLSHTGLDGSTPGDRATAAGYDWNFVAENIAQGYGSDSSVIAAWMGSPGHRSNMLDARAEDFGLGLVDTTWVLMFGREFAQDEENPGTTGGPGE